MISIGLDIELVGYIRECVESNEEISDLILELYNELQDKNALKRTLYIYFLGQKELDAVVKIAQDRAQKVLDGRG